MPLWLLVAMVDDDPDEGPDHYNFNEDLAAKGYAVDVIASDGWKATLDSADIAHNVVILSPTPLTASHFLQKPQEERAAGPSPKGIRGIWRSASREYCSY